MGIMYTASGTDSLSTAGEFINLEASAGNPYIVHRIEIGQYSDAGDAQAEMLRVRIVRFTGSQGATGGTNATESPHEVGMVGSLAIGRVGSTDFSGTPTTIIEQTWNVQAGYLYLPTPEERILCNPSNGIAAVCVDAPNDEISFTASITYEELMLFAP